MGRDFECDTEECKYWDVEDGCTKRAPITLQEHCCCDFEEVRFIYGGNFLRELS
jgi:hypothetical protein